jgi:hypothetical protein
MPDSTFPAGPAVSETIIAELCVVGGGMAGICAALAAARHGVKTVLVHDRAVLGGNASSEVRMWINGAYGRDAKETGLIEEIQLLNLRRNRHLSYPVWDTVLFELVGLQPNLTLILSCAVTDIEMAAPDRISAVRAWHLTRQRWIRVEAIMFADCSGDSVLRLSGAQTRWGREARCDFGESLALETADRKTMGNSILLQVREIDEADHVPFERPPWVHDFPLDHHRLAKRVQGDNFWWLEIGGEDDTIADADRTRNELYRMALGAWAFIKNHPDGRGHRWELEWIGALPGKRENVRYVGDHTMTQMDVEDCGRFDDIVCHGGWTMDDHPPAAFRHVGDPTTYHPAPSPFGIPWRCLYSINVRNLLFAGRNISATHMAMSATRVMATCATMGQAIGTGAAIALTEGLTPREVGQQRLRVLQGMLLEDDQYLPGFRRAVPGLARAASLTCSRGQAEALRDGIDRRLGEEDHWWKAVPGDWVEYRFEKPMAVGRVRIVCDTELHKPRVLPCSVPLRRKAAGMPTGAPKDLRISGQLADGTWTEITRVAGNHQRLIVVPVEGSWLAIRLTMDATWGNGESAFFAFDVGESVCSEWRRDAPWTSKPIRRSSGA